MGKITCEVIQRAPMQLDCDLGNIDQGTGAAAFLFAIFCAHWAMGSERNPWLWFFAGLILAPITGLVLLYKTSVDRQSTQSGD